MKMNINTVVSSMIPETKNEEERMYCLSTTLLKGFFLPLTLSCCVLAPHLCLEFAPAVSLKLTPKG